MPVFKRNPDPTDPPAGPIEEERRSDLFTREQVEEAQALAQAYEDIKGRREANREILRHLARLGKISRERVDSIYRPRQRRSAGT